MGDIAQAASAGEAAAQAALKAKEAEKTKAQAVENAKRAADAAAGAEAKRLRLERKAEAAKRAVANAAVVDASDVSVPKKTAVKRPKPIPSGNEICLSDGEDEVVCTPGGAAAISLDLDDDDAAPSAKAPKTAVATTELKPVDVSAQDAKSVAATSDAKSATDAKTEDVPAAAALDGEDGAWL